jgi:hypothetical protein
MTASEAFQGLVTIIGGGGLVSVIIAFFSFKTQAMKGRVADPTPMVIAASSGGPQAKDMELLTQALTGLTSVLLRQVVVMEEAAERKERERELRILIEELNKGRPVG